MVIKNGRLIASISVGLLIISLVKPCASVYAEEYRSRYELSQSQINYSNTQKNILIYHSHTLEDYTNSNIVKAGDNLSSKLTDLGYNVVHIRDNFSENYDLAYDMSREYLQGIELSKFDLVIDLHRDALNSSNTATINYKEVAKAMMVYSQTSDNYESIKSIGNEIGEPLYELGILREDWEYENGINKFNQDLGDKNLLIELGNNSNDKWEIFRLNTYLAKAINNYLGSDDIGYSNNN